MNLHSSRLRMSDSDVSFHSSRLWRSSSRLNPSGSSLNPTGSGRRGGGCKAAEARCKPAPRQSADREAARRNQSLSFSFFFVVVVVVEGRLSDTQRSEFADYELDLNFKKAKAEAQGEKVELP